MPWFEATFEGIVAASKTLELKERAESDFVAFSILSDRFMIASLFKLESDVTVV